MTYSQRCEVLRAIRFAEAIKRSVCQLTRLDDAKLRFLHSQIDMTEAALRSVLLSTYTPQTEAKDERLYVVPRGRNEPHDL